MDIWVQYNYTYITYCSVFQLKAPWRLGNIQLVLIIAVVEVFLQEDSFHFELKNISGTKSTCKTPVGKYLRGFKCLSFSLSMKVHKTSCQLATSYEILVASTEFLVSLATGKVYFGPWILLQDNVLLKTNLLLMP